MGIEKKLCRKIDDTVDEAGFYNRFADVAFARAFGSEGALGEDEAGGARGLEVVQEVLDPGVVGVSRRRGAEFPAAVLSQQFARPVGIVEGRIGDDEIGLEVVEEGTFVVPLHLRAVDSAYGEVHLAKAPGGEVRFLAVDGDVVHPPLSGLNKFFRLHEHAARTAAGVENTAFVWFEHFDQEFDDATGRVELAALLALREGEFAQEVLENVT